MAVASNTLVIGASGGIAQAIIKRQLSVCEDHRIVAITQNVNDLCAETTVFHDRVNYLSCDYSEASISVLANGALQQQGPFDYIFICNGVLHGDNYFPEKKLADFDSESFLSVITANTLTPMRWLTVLDQFTAKKAFITLFSARVGSISDNQLGGWYSYRASKAALNMLVKTAAIELTRRHKQWQLVLFHPGTTDTALSKPFQANVPRDKLFQPEFVAEQLFSILQTLPGEYGVHYLDWKGDTINW